jgi:hypothetical protein
MAKFSHTLLSAPDVAFCLNTGHMKSCVRYGAYLAARHQRLVDEMQYRGFTPTHPAAKTYQFRFAYTPLPEWIAAAFVTVSPRILERLGTMARGPKWTNRWPSAPQRE